MCSFHCGVRNDRWLIWKAGVVNPEESEHVRDNQEAHPLVAGR